jgi:glucose-1-phosphate adenylyltransferase
VIKNSVIMPNVIIGDNVIIEKAIIASCAIIENESKIGDGEEIAVIAEREEVAAGSCI